MASIKRRPILLPVRNRLLPPPRSLGAIRANMTFRSKSFSVVSATLTSTPSVASGVCPLYIRAFLDMRSSAVSLRSALQSPNSNPATLLPVGCLVDSDGNCTECQAGLEQFCPHMTLTFNSPDAHFGGITYGGYSDSIVVKEHFVLRVPSNLNLAGASASLMRRNYNILAHAALGGHQRQEGRCDRSWRSGSYGSKVCSCAWSPCCSLYHFP